MKSLIASITLFVGLTPTLCFARPAGHDICRGTVSGKRVQLIFGTYALTGGAELKINGRTYEFAPDRDANPELAARDAYSAKNENGEIQNMPISGRKYRISLSVDILDMKAPTKFSNQVLTCKVLDYRNTNPSY